MNTSFFALVHRLRYIRRWGLMRNTDAENVQEHSHEVAVIAHALALIRRERYAEGRICPSPDYTAALALYHDVPEILTGDLPTPIKYYNDPMRATYRAIETEAAERLALTLPEALRPVYRAYLSPDADDPETREALILIKAADRFAACIKCLDELKVGNREFERAMCDIRDRLEAIDLPEVRWFAAHALPDYAKSLDELSDGSFL